MPDTVETSQLTIEAVEAMLAKMTPEGRAAIRTRIAPMAKKVWLPQPGPQTRAFYSDADELLYGGAAGGGKSELLIGLALTQHQNSVLFRRQSNDLDTLWDRLNEVAQPIVIKNDSQKKKMRTSDGRNVFGGHLEAPGSEKSHQGRARDFYGFDEGAQLDEAKVVFVTQWLRSVTPGQRKRVVIATNPPIPEMKDGVMTDAGTGDWLLRWFAPWLDVRFPNPAKEGELRWCFMRADGDRFVTVWVDGPGCYDPVTGNPRPDATAADIDAGTVSVARSRTFIRSLVKDNIFLKGTGYAEKLSSTPEPLKSMLLRGDFTVKGEDHPMQVIPTNWVLAAEDRWEERRRELELNQQKLKQLVLFGDIAQGGVDTTVLASLLETNFFEDLVAKPGRDTPTGKEVTSLILTTRRNRSLIVLDAGGGWAGSTTAHLEQNNLGEGDVEQFVSSKASTNWTPDMVYKYANLRTEMWWEFRLALDPQSEFEICLPPRSRLRAQLTTPHWKPKGKLLYIESKDDIRTRLNGASTDEADAVLGAWHYREQALARMLRIDVDIIDKIVHGKTEADVRRQRNTAEDLDDPLRDW